MIAQKHIDRLAGCVMQLPADYKAEALLSYHQTFTEHWGTATADALLVLVRERLAETPGPECL